MPVFIPPVNAPITDDFAAHKARKSVNPGTDYACPVGTPVVAIGGGGVVTKVVNDIAGAGGREIYVDIDVDVCDRSVAPACPASVPGGISADELRQAANLVARDSRVRAIDITEIDAAICSRIMSTLITYPPTALRRPRNPRRHFYGPARFPE